MGSEHRGTSVEETGCGLKILSGLYWTLHTARILALGQFKFWITPRGHDNLAYGYDFISYPGMQRRSVCDFNNRLIKR